MQCRSCGEPFLGPVNFCFKCGTGQLDNTCDQCKNVLVGELDHCPTHGIICAICGSVLIGEVAYCPNCGKPQGRKRLNPGQPGININNDEWSTVLNARGANASNAIKALLKNRKLTEPAYASTYRTVTLNRNNEWLVVNENDEEETYRVVRDDNPSLRMTSDGHRAYFHSKRRTLRGWVPTSQRNEILSRLYSEVCNSWRALTDVRFRLLGLVPTVSVAAWYFVLDPTKHIPGILQAFISLFGLIVIIALYVYEKRNTELYNDLVSRARTLEAELGIDTGQFLGRRLSIQNLFGVFKIQHDVSITIVYTAAMLGWGVSLLFGVLLSVPEVRGLLVSLGVI